MIVTGAQIRAARALLNVDRRQLAKAAGLHPNAVKYWEARTVPADQPYAVREIARALAAQGVEAFADPQPGVRFVSQRQMAR